MAAAIRRTLDQELALNPRVLLFGEDIGPKGGVHGVTQGLQEKHGFERVFDTSLSEEGIVGRAVGMAIAGLLPVLRDVASRPYATAEQLNNCAWTLLTIEPESMRDYKGALPIAMRCMPR